MNHLPTIIFRGYVSFQGLGTSCRVQGEIVHGKILGEHMGISEGDAKDGTTGNTEMMGNIWMSQVYLSRPVEEHTKNPKPLVVK